VAAEGLPGAYRVHEELCQQARRGGRAGGGRRPGRARRAGQDGKPITDGVFPETKEFLAGYWIVDVESPERAYAIAAEASAAPGPGGEPLNMGIEVRQVMSGPPKDLL
jgi:hypothetical protein